MAVFRYEAANIRFGEFDLGGVLYHGNYFHVYEMARESFLAAGPMSYATLVKLQCHLAVSESRQRFLKPIRYGDPFNVELSCASLKRASLDVQYRFYRGSEELHRGVTSLVFVQSDGADFSVQPLPAALREYFGQFEIDPLF